MLAKIINKAKKNDRKAIRKLYDLQAEMVISICERYARDIPTAKDCAQKTFIKIFQNLNRFDIKKGSFNAWAKRIAINECLMHIRGSSLNLVELQSIETDDDFLIEMDQPDIDTKLFQLIQALPQGYRTVLLLHVVDEYSHKEIAEILGIAEATSRSQLFKAKKMLRTSWEELELSKKKAG